jgi:quinol monooxygenase YgiN
MAKVTIVANIIAKDGCIDLIRTELAKVINITRGEDGCINYDLYQDNDNPAHFFLFENWETRELWQAHMGNKHLQEYAEAVQGAVEQFTLNELTYVG